jgi:hypothetical protein
VANAGICAAARWWPFSSPGENPGLFLIGREVVPRCVNRLPERFFAWRKNTGSGGKSKAVERKAP